jgi:hypothetical protein
VKGIKKKEKLLITTTPSERGVKRTKENKQMLQKRVIALLELLESNPSGKRPILGKRLSSLLNE